MTFWVHVPPHEPGAKLPVAGYLHGAYAAARIDPTLRTQPGRDHGCSFVAAIMADRLARHAERLL